MAASVSLWSQLWGQAQTNSCCKVLLDENLDHALRHLLGPHQVMTVAYLEAASLKNGELLRITEDNGVEVFLAGDETPVCEQNVTGRRVVGITPLALPLRV